jgi:FkbM family methyltransferase
MKSYPSKEVILNGERLVVHGLTNDDGYFASIDSNFETEFCELCNRLILPDYVCIDVGANIGINSLILSRHCRDGRIIAIEPGPTVVRCLESNISANGAKNIRVEQTVVGERQALVGFEEHSAWGHLSEDGAKMPMTTLEEIVSRLQVPRVDFIKLDVEGSEFSIMRSSLDLINRFDSLVLVELNALTQLVWGKTNPLDFIDWVLANFSHVLALRQRGSAGDLLEPITSARGLLHRNMVHDGCVTDLLVTNCAQRLVPSATYLEQQLKASRSREAELYTELNVARANRDSTIAELSAVQAKCDALTDKLNSVRAKCDCAMTELNAMRAKCDAVTARCDSLLGSASWRVTAPLRWLRDRFGHW